MEVTSCVVILLQLILPSLGDFNDSGDWLTKNKHKNCDTCWIALILTWSTIGGVAIGYLIWISVRRIRAKMAESRQNLTEANDE